MKLLVNLSNTLKTLLISIPFLFFLCTCSKSDFRQLPVHTYISKMKSGWIGQMAGVGWGAPTEFKWQGKMIPSGDLPEWHPEMINQFNQDDLYVEMTFLHTLDQYGLEVSIHQAGIDFANSRYMLWHANRAGRENLRTGIAPPWSGHPRFNSHADDIDYQIEADYAGLISPGLLQSCVDLGEIFGRLMNYGDGLYGGQFVAGMYAEAFFETNVEKIVQAGLTCIPEQSQYARCIEDVIRWYKQNPDSWEKTWQLVENKYQKNRDFRQFSCSGPESDFNIDAKINGAYIVMGLLYGHGNFEKTIEIAMRCGQDSDCNPSNAAGILATMMDYENLPEKFTAALDTAQNFSYTGYNFSHLVNVCEKLARQTVIYYGGKIKSLNNEEVFLIPVKTPVPEKIKQSWQPSDYSEEQHFTTGEMSQIKYTTPENGEGQ